MLGILGLNAMPSRRVGFGVRIPVADGWVIKDGPVGITDKTDKRYQNAFIKARVFNPKYRNKRPIVEIYCDNMETKQTKTRLIPSAEAEHLDEIYNADQFLQNLS